MLRLYAQRLYRMDARKFIVTELPPIGCIPYMRETEQCLKVQVVVTNVLMKWLQSTTLNLKKLVNKLRGKLEGSTFVFVHVYDIVSDIMQNYQSFGTTFFSPKEKYIQFFYIEIQEKNSFVWVEYSV